MRKKSILTFVGLSVVALAPAHAADFRTQVIASTCFSCHGPDGKSENAIPPLAGIDKDKFVRTMKQFKDGTKPSTVMKKHASGYTNEEFEAMGAYFASMK